jgi:hypothetical protein
MSTLERPHQPPRLQLRDLVSRLPEQEHLDLGNALGAGLQDARLAAQYCSDPGPQAEDVGQILADLRGSIRQLTATRDILGRAMEDDTP